MSERKARKEEPFPLAGTTLRVYRYMYQSGRSLGIHEIQNALRLSSSSVAEYHVRKLESAGLVTRDENARYFVNRVVFENMIRIRRSLIPLQTAYALSFGTGLALMLLLFRPPVLNSGYFFALILVALACGIFSYQALKAAKKAAI